MQELKRAGVAIVFVSHNLDMVSRMCDRAILLQRGKVKACGEPGEVIGRYFDSVAEEKVERLEKATIEPGLNPSNCSTRGADQPTSLGPLTK